MESINFWSFRLTRGTFSQIKKSKALSRSYKLAAKNVGLKITHSNCDSKLGDFQILQLVRNLIMLNIERKSSFKSEAPNKNPSA